MPARSRSASLPLLLGATLVGPVFAPVRARAAGDLGAEVSTQAQYSSNVNGAVGNAAEADTILTVSPTVSGSLETRGLQTSLRYSLFYFQYQKAKEQDRLLHDLAARMAVIWWENVDLEVNEHLMPRPLQSSRPTDDPANNVQGNRLSGRVGLRTRLGQRTGFGVGYDAERVDYFKLRPDDPDPETMQDYLSFGPSARFGHEITARMQLSLSYGYRTHLYDEKAAAPEISRLEGHQAMVGLGYEAGEWLSVQANVGGQRVTNDAGETNDGASVELSTRSRGALVTWGVSAQNRLTLDVTGQPVEAQTVAADLSVAPLDWWNVGLRATYGAQASLFERSSIDAALPRVDNRYVQADLSFGYRFSIGLLEITAGRYQTLPEDDAEAIEVNRAALRLGGSF